MEEKELEAGDIAPKFCLNDEQERKVCSGDLMGKWAVVYFYPKDNTPGCTTEGKDFRDHYAEFEKLNAVVLGVSEYICPVIS